MRRFKPVNLFGFGALTGALAIGLLAFTDNDRKAPLEVKPDGRIQYKWYPPALPEQLSFAGEAVPLERWDIRESLDRELVINSYGHSNTMYILKLKTRIFPVIEPILRKHGIPDDFKYLCAAESSLQNLTSRAGAVGYWQFMSATAKQFNLELNAEVDERYHLERSTEAACRYLRAAYDKFGNWTAAAASYNCGMGGYNSRVNFQGSSRYYDLILPEETNRYIFRILALKEILADPEKYGFYLPKTDRYQPLPVRTVTVTSSIPNLNTFARSEGTSYKILRTLNPWLRSTSLTISSGNSYDIQLPAN